MVEEDPGISLRKYASEHPIEFDTPQVFMPRPGRKQQPATPIAFPMGLGVITPEISRIMEDVFVARHSPLAALAEEGPAAA